MQKRTLGKSGLEVSALGFRCMGISFGYGPAASRDEGIAIIRAAVDGGDLFLKKTDAHLPSRQDSTATTARAPRAAGTCRAGACSPRR